LKRNGKASMHQLIIVPDLNLFVKGTVSLCSMIPVTTNGNGRLFYNLPGQNLRVNDLPSILAGYSQQEICLPEKMSVQNL